MVAYPSDLVSAERRRCFRGLFVHGHKRGKRWVRAIIHWLSLQSKERFSRICGRTGLQCRGKSPLHGSTKNPLSLLRKATHSSACRYPCSRSCSRRCRSSCPTRPCCRPCLPSKTFLRRREACRNRSRRSREQPAKLLATHLRRNELQPEQHGL